ncbi:MAG: C45 family autoproteolytic acyltransferase/hydrolase [Alphaproteobacteria bacterium]
MTPSTLPVVEVGGSPYEIGFALGRHAARAIHEQVRALAAFKALLPWRRHPYTAELEAAARRRTPAYVAEIEGLAAGADWPFEEAFLWNAKGDLRAAGEPPGHGCTTLFAVEDAVRWIVHNEDGAAAHHADVFMVRARPAEGLAFTSFAYPGLICGNSFAVNAMGVVQTLNNLRARDGRVGTPRQLVARALLDCAGLDGPLAILRGWTRASGYHHGLAQAGDPRLLSIEAPASGVAARRVEGRHVHANHLIEEDFAGLRQVVTASSARRQERAAARFLEAREDALDVLFDAAIHGRGGGGDDGWTLATARFRLDAAAVHLEVFQGDPSAPVFTETVRR